MRGACNALKNASAAIGDPVQHPLRGIEQTRWTPGLGAANFKISPSGSKTRSAKSCDSADAFAALSDFRAGFYDHADIPRLAAYGDLLTRAEAADGVLFLGPRRRSPFKNAPGSRRYRPPRRREDARTRRLPTI